MKVLNFKVLDSVTERFIVISQLNEFSIDIIDCDIILGLFDWRILSLILIVASKLTKFSIRLDNLLLDRL